MGRLSQEEAMFQPSVSNLRHCSGMNLSWVPLFLKCFLPRKLPRVPYSKAASDSLSAPSRSTLVCPLQNLCMELPFLYTEETWDSAPHQGLAWQSCEMDGGLGPA